MLSQWNHFLGLALLTLSPTPIFGSILSEIQSGASSAEAKATQVIGNLEGDLTNFEQAVQTELSSALKSSDGVIAHFAMGHELAPPISTQLKKSHLDSNVTIGLYCDLCGYSQPAAFNFAKDKYSGYEDSWLGFSLDSFDALFEVEVTLSANANGDLTMSLFKLTAAEEGIVVEVEFQLYLVASASASLSFIAGLDLKLTEPAAIMMPALDPVVNLNESQRVGFNNESFSLTPIFNASMPKLDFSVQFSLRTVFSVTVEKINIGALYLDLPAFNLTVETMTNALSNCQIPPSGTSPDKIYRGLIHTTGAFVAELSYELLGGAKNGTLETWTMYKAWDRCFAFLPGLGALGEVPSSPKSKALTAPPITTCTTSGSTNATGVAAVNSAIKALSPGAKAGAVIGTLIGAALIAAISWFSGRAALNRSMKNSNTSSNAAWAFPSPRFDKFKSFSFFKRGSGSGHPPATQNTPTWQNTPYQVEQYAGFNPETPQQAWQMAQKEPVVTATETMPPAPRHVSMGDDDGVSSLGSGEVNAAGFDARWQPSVYGSPDLGSGRFSGSVEARPAVPRKEIQRKSVPGHVRGAGSS